MRVFVAVQPTPRSGASSLSRYIAQSKVDRDREQVDEKGSRPLFSEREDILTYREADRILNPTSGELEKEDVIHVVISPERGSFERAGDTDAERKQTFREAIRDAVHKMARELKVRFLNWIGGLHGNTRTPHGHLAVSRWALDEKTGKLVYIKHLPESLLPRNLEGDDGTKRFSTGKIAEFFARSFNLKRKPVRFLQVRDHNGGIEISRSVLSPYALMLREPTPQERVVGRWIDSELTLAREVGEEMGAREELTKECIELRGLVAQLDAAARAQGARPTAGYVEAERLEELIRHNNSGLRVKVFTERPHGEKERHVETTIGQPATREEKQTLAVPQDLEQGDVKAAMSTPQISKPSPATTAQVKSNRQPEAEGARPGRAPSARARTARVGPAPGPKQGQARDKVEIPRVATKTLEELRSHTVLSRNPDTAFDKASQATEATREHKGETYQTGNKEGIQLVESAITVLAARTERDPADVDRSAGNLATTKEPLRESRLTDKELGWLAHEVRVNRLYLERDRDIIKDVIMQQVAQIQTRGDRDRARTVEALEPLNAFELMVREAILLDLIYDDARRKRNIPTQRLSDTEENLLRGRDSWQVTQLKNSLPDEMELAKERLLFVAPLVNPRRLQEYNKYQEDQRALAALDRDRGKEIAAALASRASERLTPETLEREPHSANITTLQGKETAASQALENTIEHVL